MAQQALYRKWRSSTFDELVGQPHVVQTLQNALDTGRVAHAYLFSGPRGTGKTSTARILAKAVNCLAPEGQRPCNQCHICRSLGDGSSMDLIEIDAASNTQVDKVRDVIVEKVNFAPSEAKYKFYVVDECFRYSDLVSLADGTKLPIGKIVEEHLWVEVLSYNEQTGKIEPKPVVRHMRKAPTLPVVRITFDNNRALVCTINHKIYTPQGMVRAGALQVGQFVHAKHEPISHFQNEVVVGAAIGARITHAAKGPSIWLTLAGTHRLHEMVAPSVPPEMGYKLLPPYRGRFQQPTDSGTSDSLAVSVVRKIERVPSPEYVYNIEVADNHNYFARGILVANCHMLSNSAFNALLKTIEEPPPHAMFVLATTEIHKIPATIISRCQRLDFRRIGVEEVVEHLDWVLTQEGITTEGEVLDLVARQATGSMRDALSLLDQLLAHGGAHLTLAQARAALGLASTEAVQALVDYVLAQDVGAALQLVNRLLDQGTDPRQFLVDVLEQLRALLLTLAGSGRRLLNLPEERLSRLRAQAQHVEPGALVEVIRRFNQAMADLKLGLQPQLPLELAIVEGVLLLQARGVAPAPPPAEGLADVEADPPAPAPPATRKRRTSPALAPAAEAPHVEEPSAAPESHAESAPSQEAPPLRAARLARDAPPPPPPPLWEEDELIPPPPAQAVRERPLAIEEAIPTDPANHSLGWWREQWEPFKAFLARQDEDGKRASLRLKFCEPLTVSEVELTLGFFYSIHLDKINTPKERSALERALATFSGHPLTVRCQLAPRDDKPQPLRSKQEQARDEALQDPVVREAMRLGANFVDVITPDNNGG